MQRTTQSVITPVRHQNKYSNTKTYSLRSYNRGQHQERVFVRQQQRTCYCFKTAFGSTGEIQQHIARRTPAAEAHLHVTADLPAENSWTSQAVGTVQTQGITSRVEFLSPTTATSSHPRAASERHSPWSAPRAAKHTESEKGPTIPKINPDSRLHKSVNGRLSQSRSSVKTEASKIN